MAISENQKKYLTNMANGKDEYGNSVDSGKVAWAKSELQKNNTVSTPANTSTPSNNDYSALSRYHNTTVHNDTSTGTITPSGVVNNGKVTSTSTKRSSNTSSPTVIYKEPTVDPDANLDINEYLAKNNAVATQPVDTSKEDALKAYQEQYEADLQAKYDALNEQTANAKRLAVQQGKYRLENQKDDVNQKYDDTARQAYVNYMMSKKNLPQQLASAGLTGGASETSRIGLESNYQNNFNTNEQGRNNTLNNIDNAIVDLQNTGDLETAQAILANNQQALNAYQQLRSEDRAYAQAEQERQDKLKQLEFENWKENTGAYSNDYQAQINALMADNANGQNDAKIMALQSERNNKLNGMTEADLYKRQQAENRMQLLGYADQEVANILGIPVGTQTQDYAYQQAQLKLKQQEMNNDYALNAYKLQSGDTQNNKIGDAGIVSYLNNALGTSVLGYDANTKNYGIQGLVEGQNGVFEGNDVVNAYKDPIIQKMAIAINNGSINSDEGYNFLTQKLGFLKSDIDRVLDYTYPQSK